jgi:hypothetical protein
MPISPGETYLISYKSITYSRLSPFNFRSFMEGMISGAYGRRKAGHRGEREGAIKSKRVDMLWI